MYSSLNLFPGNSDAILAWTALKKLTPRQTSGTQHFHPTAKILLGCKQGSQSLLPAPAVSQGGTVVLLTVPSVPQDYWLSLLYKRLIGPKVLAIHVAGLQRKHRPGRVIRDKLRIYAHCTSYHK